MKRLIASLSVLGVMTSAMAQSTDDIKNLLILSQYKQAKEKLNTAMTKPKFTAKPEAYLILATTDAQLMNDPANAAEAEKLRAEGEEAYQKYLQMDPSKKLVVEPPYNNAPILFYSSYFNEGIKNYNKKDWDAAGVSFDNCVKWSDFLIENKVASMQFDTSAVVLAGAVAQNGKKDDKAYSYFKRITDRKIGGADNEFVYQFMMRYSFDRNNMADFEKYRALGKEIYPNTEYFTYTEDDFIMGMEDEVEKRKRIEAKIAANPNDPELAENYGLILFETLNDPEKKVDNYDELEQKMITNLSKAGDLKPNDGKPYFYLGNHYVNKGVAINQEIDKVTDEIKKANASAKPDPKTGKLPPPPKELTAKRDELRAKYDAEIDKGIPYLKKSAEAYGRNPDLKGIDKQNYKRVADQLIIIYENKARATKVPADKAKFDAEAKKWSDIYSKIPS